jgi:hypothetical protein
MFGLVQMMVDNDLVETRETFRREAKLDAERRGDM